MKDGGSKKVAKEPAKAQTSNDLGIGAERQMYGVMTLEVMLCAGGVTSDRRSNSELIQLNFELKAAGTVTQAILEISCDGSCLIEVRHHVCRYSQPRRSRRISAFAEAIYPMV